MRYQMGRYYPFILIVFLTSCGEPSEKCKSQEEAILRCQADLVAEYFPGKAPELLMNQCKSFYPTKSCY